jgi:hypothetical protein
MTPILLVLTGMMVVQSGATMILSIAVALGTDEPITGKLALVAAGISVIEFCMVLGAMGVMIAQQG